MNIYKNIKKVIEKMKIEYDEISVKELLKINKELDFIFSQEMINYHHQNLRFWKWLER